jgi:hypothetical protein
MHNELEFWIKLLFLILVLVVVIKGLVFFGDLGAVVLGVLKRRVPGVAARVVLERAIFRVRIVYQ